MVAMECGGCFRRVSKVKPGNLGYPLTRAFYNVDMAGENSVACAKATRLAALGVVLMAAAVKLIGTGIVGAGVVEETCHNLVDAEQWPWRMH